MDGKGGEKLPACGDDGWFNDGLATISRSWSERRPSAAGPAALKAVRPGSPFGLQINPVSLAGLGCHEERVVAQLQRLDVNMLHVALQLRIKPVLENGQVPELFVGFGIRRDDVGASAVVIRDGVATP